MNQEIERKFIVVGDGWRALSEPGIAVEQGYLSASSDGATVRVRLAGEKGWITIKGPTEGISRPELEYEIPSDDAVYLLRNLCLGRIVSKTRYRLGQKGLVWEIDEFSGKNKGLVLAEIELTHEDQAFDKPDWLGKEVSFDSRYFNSALAKNPFSQWEF
jgi:CYTH domain-containing protein